MKKIKAEVKRAPANVMKYGKVLAPVLSVIPGVGGILGGLTGVLGGLGGGGGSEVLSADPVYAPGGTPLGQGSMGRVNPGQEFGGRPVAQRGTFLSQTAPFPAINPMLLLAGGGLLLIMMLRR